jgi:hypothetical protein
MGAAWLQLSSREKPIARPSGIVDLVGPRWLILLLAPTRGGMPAHEDQRQGE